MAYIVTRPGKRWEIRESKLTARGPRSRTLASFSVLTEDVIARALAGAETPIDAARLKRAAARAGVPLAEPRAEAAARVLLEEVNGGRWPSPDLRRRLWEHLGQPSVTGTAALHEEGAGIETATPAQHGELIRQLLDLTDKLPHPEPGPLRYPRMPVTVH